MRISWGKYLLDRQFHQFLAPAERGQAEFRIPGAPISYPAPGTKLPELNLVVEPAEIGTVTFQAEGLTLGGRLERRMVYRYQGLVN